MAKISIHFEDGQADGEVQMEVQVTGLEQGDKPTPAVNAGLQAWNLIKGVLSAQQKAENRIETPPEPELILPPGAKD